MFSGLTFNAAPAAPQRTGSFRNAVAPPAYEEFMGSNEDRRRRSSRNGYWAAVTVYAIYAVLDHVVVADVSHLTDVARLVVCTLTIAAVELLYRAGYGADAIDAMCAFGIVAGFFGWLIPASMTQNASLFGEYIVFGSIFMLGANLFFKFRLRLALTTCLCILVGMVGFAAANDHFEVEHDVLIVVYYVSVFAFSFYVNWASNRERYRTFMNERLAAESQAQSELRGKELMRMSRTDSLTRIANRRLLDEQLQAAWESWIRRGTRFALFLVDVDFFKKYNDWHGHVRGDEALRAVAAKLIGEAADFGGTAGRFGGEEFMVIAPLSSRDSAMRLAERIRQSVENLAIRHQSRSDGSDVVTVSIGVTLVAGSCPGRIERVVQEADEALYFAKHEGRNCVRFFEERDVVGRDLSEDVAALLKIGVEKNLLSLDYQPILNVRTGQVECVEALMRLRTLDGSLVPPPTFIPIAERTGAIATIGAWALERVCREVLAPGLMPMASVNVSAVQLRNPGFASTVAAILADTGISGERLAFEITEGIDLDFDDTVFASIRQLRDIGIRIWLDDFGTGFAGLSWLRLVDFDTVKIDKSFLHDIDRPGGEAILLDIIKLVRNRGSKILIEGVETAEHVIFAQRARLDHFQGFHLARPRGIAELARIRAAEIGATA